MPGDHRAGASAVLRGPGSHRRPCFHRAANVDAARVEPPRGAWYGAVLSQNRTGVAQAWRSFVDTVSVVGEDSGTLVR